MGDEEDNVSETPQFKVRDLVGFWILGLCNNFGYVVMLTAAYDILDEGKDQAQQKPDARICNKIATGAILLADILPCLIIKVLSPFFPQHSTIRMLVTIVLGIFGYIFVALGRIYVSRGTVISGVVCTSFSSGVGESSLLAYMAHFHRNVVSAWSSGTGGAGVLGSLVYAGLREIPLSIPVIMFLMLSVPLLMGVSYFIIVTSPIRKAEEEAEAKERDKNYCLNILKNLLHVLKKAITFWRYIVPLSSVYFFEYLINQALYELVEYDNFILNHHSQYRWLQVGYQIGVIISRSSVNIVYIPHIWIFPILQLCNVVFFLSEVLIYYIPSYWIILLVAIYEGLIGGGGYVNTYTKIHRTYEDPIEREFCMGTVSVSDTFGISMAGVVSLPVHNVICGLSKPTRKLMFGYKWL